MQKIYIFKIIFCAIFIFLVGCDSRQTDTTSKINTIKIVDIQPLLLSEPLKVGQRIDVKVKLTYRLESKAATVTLVVLRKGGFGNKSLANSFVIIQQGRGELLLSGELYVPETKALEVRVTLTPQQRNDSVSIETRTYKVEL